MQLTHDEIVRLSPEERLSLIAQLCDSPDDSDIPITSAQTTELTHRLSTLDEDRADAVTWDSLKAELARRRP